MNTVTTQRDMVAQGIGTAQRIKFWHRGLEFKSRIPLKARIEAGESSVPKIMETKKLSLETEKSSPHLKDNNLSSLYLFLTSQYFLPSSSLPSNP